jgi:hypothetical protein
MNSPLGRYGPLAAAIVAIGVIGAYLAASLLQLGTARDIKDFALIALGAVLATPNIVGNIRSGTTNFADGAKVSAATLGALAVAIGATVIIAR